ncbi:MAG: DUF72 domain-containing protein [Candidatus Bathyarchaeia archaeon]
MLPDFLVGTGGWAYFNVPNKTSLKAYSEVFNFVEVNYTFYEFPDIRLVEAWRKMVPEDFTFSVRCHQNLTHKVGFRPVNEAYEIFYQTRSYCDVLRSQYLVLETPAKYVIESENLHRAKDFFSSLNLDGIKLVWEYRAPMTPTVTNLMEDFGIIHCVDLSKENPSYNSDVTYSRLFGKGQQNIYQFADSELVEIDQKAQATRSKTVILSYHGVRMNSDAVRFKEYKRTGSFIPVTAFTGADSAKAVLAEDAKFPITKSELIVEQGWKVIDASQDRRVHLSEVLIKIPDKTYSSLNEVMSELRVVI